MHPYFTSWVGTAGGSAPPTDSRQPKSPWYPTAKEAVWRAVVAAQGRFRIFGYSKYPNHVGVVYPFDSDIDGMRWFETSKPGYEFVALFDVFNDNFWPYPILYTSPYD
jgi:hypothetical protein